MSQTENLYVIWKNPISRERFIIGQLTKNETFEFSYFKDATTHAKEAGFHLLNSFPDIEKTYTSSEIFPAFEVRLPDKRRRDIENILAKYDLNEYDAFGLLKKTQGKLPIDTLQFIEPLFVGSGEIVKDFYIAGTRHYLDCSGQEGDCEFPLNISIGDKLVLKKERTNQFDYNAVEVYTVNNEKIGYIPKYYSCEVSRAIDENRKLSCVVKKIIPSNCQECVQATLIIYAIQE